jgi:hypothetical protein
MTKNLKENKNRRILLQDIMSFIFNESLNTINKGNGNKVSSVGIIVFHVEAA